MDISKHILKHLSGNKFEEDRVVFWRSPNNIHREFKVLALGIPSLRNDYQTVELNYICVDRNENRTYLSNTDMTYVPPEDGGEFYTISPEFLSTLFSMIEKLLLEHEI